MKHLEMIFSILLTASLASTAILLLLFLIRKLFKKHLSPRVVHLLWFIVLIKLLVPITPQSAISLFNLFPQTVNDERTWHQKNIQADISSEPDSGSKVIFNTSEAQSQFPESIPNQTEQSASTLVTPSPQDQVYGKDQDGLSWLTIGSLVWFSGFLFLGGYYLFSTLIFRKRVRNSCKIDNQEVLSVLEACKEKLDIRKAIPIYETSSLRSPCLYGVIKPGIYLPEDIVSIADSRQLTHILLHELTHYKRKDLWFNSLWTLSLGLHWYNPFVWLAVKKIKADQEVACDSGVLEVLGERESSSYGMTLLMLSRLFSRDTTPRINLSHFFDNKHDMKRRITMISKFKKGSYKLSAVTILLVLSLSAVLLTSASDAANGTKSGVTIQEASTKGEIPSTFKDEFYQWLHSLDRALDFKKFEFKVPNYVPDGYQFTNVEIDELPYHPHDDYFLDVVKINFTSNAVKKSEQTIEALASEGHGNLLESNRLWGAPQGEALAPDYQQEAVTIGNVKGTIFTETRNDSNQNIDKSFVWEDGDVWYAINYNNENISQENLTKMVQSFVFPQQVQHVRYDGEGNSFPLYDQKDVLAAKNVLGINLKLPINLNGTEFFWNDTYLLKAGQNHWAPFKMTADTLWTTLLGPIDSQFYDKNAGLDFFQSKAPLFDTDKLSFIRKLEINGVEISAYADNDHVYFGPYLSDDETKELRQIYYLWKQGDIYYTANFFGIDKDPEEHLKNLVLTPLQ
jgi:bla regulator protein blaR1